MISVSEEAIGRAICKCWSTIYSNESVSLDWSGRGQGFNITDLIDGEFQIDFKARKEWWIPGQRVADVKKIVKQKLKEAGLDVTKLKIYGSTHNVSWYGECKFCKYVGIYKIIFTEKFYN